MDNVTREIEEGLLAFEFIRWASALFDETIMLNMTRSRTAFESWCRYQDDTRRHPQDGDGQ